MPATAIKTGPGRLTIGATDSPINFAAQITEANLKPSVSSEDDIEVLSGETVAGADTETWVLSGKMNADLGQDASAQEYCFTHAGEQVPFTFSPNSATGRQFTGVVKIRATAFGGEVGKTSQIDFELPVVGRPVMASIQAAKSAGTK